MKEKILSLLFILFLFTPVFSLAFTMEEYPIFNNYFYSKTNQNLGATQINGWTQYKTGGTGTSTLTPYYLDLYGGGYGYVNGFQQLTSNNMTGNVSVYVDFNVNLNAPTYNVKIDAQLYQGATLKGSVNLATFSSAYYGDISGYFDINLGSDWADTIKIFTYSISAPYGYYSHFKFKSIRLFNKDSLTTSYNYELINPSNDNQSFYTSNIPIIIRQNKYSTEMNYYIPDTNNYNATTGAITYSGNVPYNYMSGAYFFYNGGITQTLTNDAVYFENSQGNNLIIKNLSNAFLNPLTDLTLNVERKIGSYDNEYATNELKIKFAKPTSSGLVENNNFYYSLILYENDEIIDYISFIDLNIVGLLYDDNIINIVESVENGINYYEITYDYYNNNPNQVYLIKAKYKESNSTTFLLSDYVNATATNYVKAFEIYDYNGTNIIKRLTHEDFTTENQIVIVPYVSGLSNPDWYFGVWDFETGKYIYNIVNEVYENQTINLSVGYNVIIIKDDDEVLDWFSIDLKYNATLLNMSLKNKYDDLICYSNDSFNNCDYNIFTDNFYSETYHNNYDYSLIRVNIYCNTSNGFDLFYTDSLTSEDTRFLDYSAYVESGYLRMLFNPTFNENSFPELVEYLKLNPNLVNLNDYDLSKEVMNWYSTQKQSIKVVFLPANTKCYMTQDFNNNTLNVSFVGSNSLLQNLKTSGIYTLIKSSCQLMGIKRDFFGNEYEEQDYLNYYVCVVSNVYNDNAETFYYLGFFFISVFIIIILKSAVSKL